MRIIKKENTDHILEAVKNNNGYCPCRIEKSDDTKCMCKEFKEQTHIGECHCGLFEKEED